MTGLAWALIVLAAVIAVVDWVAVGTGNLRLEYVAKPATMVPLIVAAAIIDAVRPDQTVWFVAALVCSLAGDVFLMLPNSERWFVPGLGSFLIGHLAYIVGLVVGGIDTGPLLVGIVLVIGGLALVAPRIVRGAAATDRRLGPPVLAYISVISIMVAFAIGTTLPLAIAGALAFYLSDACIGWSRFVAEFPRSRLAIITTYHAAQLLLVLSLATG